MKKTFYSILGMAVVALIFVANVASVSACYFDITNTGSESLRKNAANKGGDAPLNDVKRG